MSRGSNQLRRQLATRSLIADASPFVDGTTSFNQGDLLYFIPSTQLITNTPASGETGSNFLGVSPVDVVSGKLRPPYIGTQCDAAVAGGGIAGPEYGSIFALVPKSGDTFTAGCRVYPVIDDASNRKVTVTSGSLACIGLYQGPTLTAGASTPDIECLIGAVYPNDVVSF